MNFLSIFRLFCSRNLRHSRSDHAITSPARFHLDGVREFLLCLQSLLGRKIVEIRETMDVDYETKKKMLFESLESAEKNLQGTSLAQTTCDYNFAQNRQQRKRGRDEYVDKYKNRDSMFKRPNLPINKCLRSRQKPEYEVSRSCSGVCGVIENFFLEKPQQVAALFTRRCLGHIRSDEHFCCLQFSQGNRGSKAV